MIKQRKKLRKGDCIYSHRGYHHTTGTIAYVKRAGAKETTLVHDKQDIETKGRGYTVESKDLRRRVHIISEFQKKVIMNIRRIVFAQTRGRADSEHLANAVACSFLMGHYEERDSVDETLIELGFNRPDVWHLPADFDHASVKIRGENGEPMTCLVELGEDDISLIRTWDMPYDFDCGQSMSQGVMVRRAHSMLPACRYGDIIVSSVRLHSPDAAHCMMFDEDVKYQALTFKGERLYEEEKARRQAKKAS